MKKILGVFLAGALFITPIAVDAQSISSLQAQIQKLVEMLEELQRRVAALQSGVADSESSASTAPVREIRITPDHGVVGQRVTIHGSGFTPRSHVFFGQGRVTDFTFVNSSTLRFEVPETIEAPCLFYSTPCRVATYATAPGEYTVLVQTGAIKSNEVTFAVVERVEDKNTKTTKEDSISSRDRNDDDEEESSSKEDNESDGETKQGDDSDESSSDSVDEEESSEATISSLSPSSGQVGSVVTISGNNFSGDSVVLFGSGEIRNVKATSSKVTFTIPSSLKQSCHYSNPPCLVSEKAVTPGTYSVQVKSNGVTSNSRSFTVSSGFSSSE